MLIYTAIVRPTLTYGAFIWWRFTLTESGKNKLRHLQRVACLAITGAMSTTPQAALEALLNLPTLDSYIIAEARATAYRLRHHITESQLRNGEHTEALTDLYRNESALRAPNDHMKTTYDFEHHYTINIPDRNDWESGRMTVDYRSHVYFADASKRTANSGYGIHMANDNRDLMGQCGKYADITQAELLAIEVCCLDALRNNKQGKISIYSDSIGALNALKSYRIDSSTVLECINILQDLATTNEVTVFWIPSGSGIYGHTQADLLAKAAADLTFSASEPQTIIKRSIARETKEKWTTKSITNAWRASTTGEHTKCFLRELNQIVSQQILNMNKNHTRIVIGLITGHCKVNSHLVKMRLRDDPDCELCGRTQETAMHIISECESIKSVRKHVYGKEIVETQQILKHPVKKLINFYQLCCEYHSRFIRIFNSEII